MVVIFKAGSFAWAIFPTRAIADAEKKGLRTSLSEVKKIEERSVNHRIYNRVGKMSEPFKEKENSFESIA